MAARFVLDKATILRRIGGDREIFAAMAAMFLQDADDYCIRLASAVAGGDAELLRREAHTVKGMLATVADESGAALALAVENRAKAGDCVGLAGMVAELEARLRLVAAAVREEIAG